MSTNQNISNVKVTANSLAEASGPVTIPMTNDYLFRALLHLPPKDIRPEQLAR